MGGGLSPAAFYGLPSARAGALAFAPAAPSSVVAPYKGGGRSEGGGGGWLGEPPSACHAAAKPDEMRLKTATSVEGGGGRGHGQTPCDFPWELKSPSRPR